jgi:hypothetical protein
MMHGHMNVKFLPSILYTLCITGKLPFWPKHVVRYTKPVVRYTKPVIRYTKLLITIRSFVVTDGLLHYTLLPSIAVNDGRQTEIQHRCWYLNPVPLKLGLFLES